MSTVVSVAKPARFNTVNRHNASAEGRVEAVNMIVTHLVKTYQVRGVIDVCASTLSVRAVKAHRGLKLIALIGYNTAKDVVREEKLRALLEKDAVLKTKVRIYIGSIFDLLHDRDFIEEFFGIVRFGLVMIHSVYYYTPVDFVRMHKLCGKFCGNGKGAPIGVVYVHPETTIIPFIGDGGAIEGYTTMEHRLVPVRGFFKRRIYARTVTRGGEVYDHRYHPFLMHSYQFRCYTGMPSVYEISVDSRGFAPIDHTSIGVIKLVALRGIWKENPKPGFYVNGENRSVAQVLRKPGFTAWLRGYESSNLVIDIEHVAQFRAHNASLTSTELHSRLAGAQWMTSLFGMDRDDEGANRAIMLYVEELKQIVGEARDLQTRAPVRSVFFRAGRILFRPKMPFRAPVPSGDVLVDPDDVHEILMSSQIDYLGSISSVRGSSLEFLKGRIPTPSPPTESICLPSAPPADIPSAVLEEVTEKAGFKIPAEKPNFLVKLPAFVEEGKLMKKCVSGGEPKTIEWVLQPRKGEPPLSEVSCTARQHVSCFTNGKWPYLAPVYFTSCLCNLNQAVVMRAMAPVPWPTGRSLNMSMFVANIKFGEVQSYQAFPGSWGKFIFPRPEQLSTAIMVWHDQPAKVWAEMPAFKKKRYLFSMASSLRKKDLLLSEIMPTNLLELCSRGMDILKAYRKPMPGEDGFDELCQSVCDMTSRKLYRSAVSPPKGTTDEPPCPLAGRVELPLNKIEVFVKSEASLDKESCEKPKRDKPRGIFMDDSAATFFALQFTDSINKVLHHYFDGKKFLTFKYGNVTLRYYGISACGITPEAFLAKMAPYYYSLASADASDLDTCERTFCGPHLFTTGLFIYRLYCFALRLTAADMNTPWMQGLCQYLTSYSLARLKLEAKKRNGPGVKTTKVSKVIDAQMISGTAKTSYATTAMNLVENFLAWSDYVVKILAPHQVGKGKIVVNVARAALGDDGLDLSDHHRNAVAIKFFEGAMRERGKVVSFEKPTSSEARHCSFLSQYLVEADGGSGLTTIPKVGRVLFKLVFSTKRIDDEVARDDYFLGKFKSYRYVSEGVPLLGVLVQDLVSGIQARIPKAKTGSSYDEDVYNIFRTAPIAPRGAAARALFTQRYGVDSGEADASGKRLAAQLLGNCVTSDKIIEQVMAVDGFSFPSYVYV